MSKIQKTSLKCKYSEEKRRQRKMGQLRKRHGEGIVDKWLEELVGRSGYGFMVAVLACIFDFGQERKWGCGGTEQPHFVGLRKGSDRMKSKRNEYLERSGRTIVAEANEGATLAAA